MRGNGWIARRRRAALFGALACALQIAPVHPGSTAPPDDCAAYASCRHCGMDRRQFAHSRLLITYTDSVTSAVCSIHCAALDLALHLSSRPQRIEVGDYRTHELIDAGTARWVIGGNRMGVMTRRAKWAFATQQSADDFIREHGGQLGDFSEALKASYEDMYDDVNMLRKKRSERR